MRRKLAPIVIWLVMAAVVASLFPRIEKSHRMPYIPVEEGIHPEFSQEAGGNLFVPKLLKKIKGGAPSLQFALRGKSLCRPVGKGGLAKQPAVTQPLFLLHHAFLFYDRP